MFGVMPNVIDLGSNASHLSVASRGYQTTASNPCLDATRKCDPH